MDALILSCGTGGGHNSAARAIEQELTARGHRAAMMNPYLLKSEKAAKIVDNAYIAVAQKAPYAFGMAYRLANFYRKLPIVSPVYLLNRRMVPLLEEYLQKNPCDAIVMTHLFPAEIITYMKRRGKAVPPAYFVATDYACIPFTEETDCDRYVTPAPDLEEDFLSRGIPKEKLCPLGIPVRREFREEVSREEARRRLGLDSEKKYILIAGGSIGAGQIQEIVPLLLEHYGAETKLLVVCGSNRSLYENMARFQGERCEIMGFTDRMPDYMHACDLLLSKPGGLSSTEAAVAGVPLIHMTPIPGCETINMNYFARKGMCLPVSSPKKELTDTCDRLLEPSAQAEMRKKQRRGIPENAAETICRLIESEVGGKTAAEPEAGPSQQNE